VSREVLRIVEHKIEGDTFGYYDPDTHTIALDSRLAEDQRRVTLLHEVAHALYGHDYLLDERTHHAVEEFAVAASALLEQLVGSPG